MKCIEEFASRLQQVNNLSTGLLTPTAVADFAEKTNKFNELVERSRYVKVPLVGIFSAGKSSLLNVFTGKPGVLPVDTMPETAVACELYYDCNERVELFRNGCKIEETGLDCIKSLHTSPGDIARVYMNSQPVKKLQDRGIILVDMPGIGSGIERHDAAIMNYINYGTAFVLLVDVEQGSLRGSTLTFLEELKKYNLKPAVLVAKADKKPATEVQEIIDYINYQLYKIIESTPYVSKVCAVNNDLSGLTSYLNGLDAEALLKQKVGNALTGIVNMVISDLKMQKNQKNQSIAEVERSLKQLEDEIHNAKMELPTRNNQADTPEKSCQDILDNVNTALCCKADEMAKMILQKECPDTIKQFAISIIRAELIASFKEEAEQYSSALGVSVNTALEEIAGISLNDNNFEAQYGDLIELACDIVKNFGGPLTKNIIVILSSLITPILNLFFNKGEAEKLAEIKDKLQSSCFNKIIEDLRPRVLNMVKENQKHIEKQLQQEVKRSFNQMKDGLEKKMKDTQSSKDAIEHQMAKIDAAIVQLTALTAEI